jgi:predicted aspartyl protease
MKASAIFISSLFSFINLFTITFSENAPHGIVPFEMHHHLIVVEVSFDKQGVFSFAVDTGSSFTVVSKHLGKQLGLKAENVEVNSWGKSVECKKVLLPRLKMGNVDVEHVEARIIGLPDIRGVQLDGLIGLDFLKRTTVSFDFQNKEIRFGDDNRLKNSLQFYSGFSFIPLTLNVSGIPVRVILDSGSSGLILYKEAIKDRIQYRRTGKTEYRPHSGGRVKLEEAYVNRVVLGETVWDELPALLLPGSISGNQHAMGNLGISSLGFSALQIDFEGGLLSWEN